MENTKNKDTLTSLSKYLVADAWFSKRSFTDKVISSGMHLVSRLRDDADLKYISTQKPTGKRGRPRKHEGKDIVKDINETNCIFSSMPQLPPLILPNQFIG